MTANSAAAEGCAHLSLGAVPGACSAAGNTGAIIIGNDTRSGSEGPRHLRVEQRCRSAADTTNTSQIIYDIANGAKFAHVNPSAWCSTTTF